MKTAISVPDIVFDQAEKLAKYLRMSRSELYSRAMLEYVARHAPDALTDALDAVHTGDGSGVDHGSDDFVREASRRALERSEW